MQGNYIHVMKDPQAAQTCQYPVFRTFYFLIIDEMFVSVLRPFAAPPVTLGVQHNIKTLLALLKIIYKRVTVIWQKDKNTF